MDNEPVDTFPVMQLSFLNIFDSWLAEPVEEEDQLYIS